MGPIAQSVEQRTFNPWVDGSSPSGPTRPKLKYSEFVLLPIGFLANALRVQPRTVLHVGAHRAEEIGLYTKHEWGNECTFWIEAQSDLTDELSQNLNLKNHHVINCLAWSTDGLEKDFHLSTNSMSSSALRFGNHLDLYPQIEVRKTVKLRTSKLETVLPTNFIPELIVLDIQGAELEALKGFKSKLGQVNWICSEISSREVYLNGPTVIDLDSFLLEVGFRRVATVWYKNHGWGDALYVNKSLLTSSLIFVLGSKIYLGLIYKFKNWISEKYYLLRAYLGTKRREFTRVKYENNSREKRSTRDLESQ